GAYRVRMQFDGSQIHYPREPRCVVDNNLFGSTARRKRKRDGPQPWRPPGGRALLVKSLALRAIDESLQHQGTIADARQSARCNREVITDEVEFGELRLPRKVQLVRVCDVDLAALNPEHLGTLF